MARPNLVIRLGATVTKIDVNQTTSTATGVHYSLERYSGVFYSVTAKYEVILTAQAINIRTRIRIRKAAPSRGHPYGWSHQ